MEEAYGLLPRSGGVTRATCLCARGASARPDFDSPVLETGTTSPRALNTGAFRPRLRSLADRSRERSGRGDRSVRLSSTFRASTAAQEEADWEKVALKSRRARVMAAAWIVERGER